MPLMNTNVRAGVAAASLAFAMLAVSGCSTKKFARAQAAPIIQKTNELDARTRDDHRAILDTDQRAQDGIASAKAAAASADANAARAQGLADRADTASQTAYNRVDSLTGVVAGLDNYKSLADVSVTFAFDKAVLSAADKRSLDEIAVKLDSTRHYIVEITGGTDSVGDAQYNYALSNRRADAVALYLQSKYNIAPHKFYLVGIGKDKEVATNRTAAGRKQNRRVDLRILSNYAEESQSSAGQ